MAQVRPMRADARRNRERLLAAAVEAFAAQGEGASLDDIAKRAGVGAGTLYRHFPTRRALLEAVYSDRIEAIAERAGVLAERLPAGAALVAWLGELGLGMIQTRGLRALLSSSVRGGEDAGPGAGGSSSDCCDPLRRAVARLVRAAQEAGELRRDVGETDVLRLVHGVAIACGEAVGGGSAGDARDAGNAGDAGDAEGAEDAGERLRRYVGLLMEGLGPRGSR
ncbi:TetR/AcrR family transcriptional regulator [Streptomyces sp. SBST2-5]|uniref:TetR/AcrR family transcriptional regulator n=1 Tax=Streptomyces composti TaxID=2720025 RepID=A0ABX1A373_9ACTN|nr:TetR/AcrR family transcriptional regulator [Streptomyces composti]NJP49432.1 TetR/AcrR family transcriptional regulator [Streptomyces composti]